VRTVTSIARDTSHVMKSQVFIPFAFFGLALVVAFIVG
jgi:hypothetical protein